MDDSADTVARTGILYNNGSYNVISGLGSADINLRGLDLSSLMIRAGSGGNTFRIHDTPDNTRGEVTTTLSTGAGADHVTIDGTTGALALDVQGAAQGANFISAGSATASFNAINGPINITGLAGAQNSLSIIDSASTTSHAYLVDRNFVQRLDKAWIDYQNMSDLTLRTGAQSDHIIVRDTMQFGIGHSVRRFP